MKIIEQSYEILDFPKDGLALLEKAGRICYKSEDKIGCAINSGNSILVHGECNPHCPYYIEDNSPTKCEYHSSQKFIRMIKNKKHTAILEFGDITVKFITNRGVTHELVRHRIASFAQKSTRYCDYLEEIEFILPVWVNKDSSAYGFFLSACEESENYYKTLRENGWRPEQAREVLPNSLKTEIIVKTNIREWRHIFKLRCSKAAHPQIRALMLPLLKELKSKIPVVFDDIF